MGKKRHFTQKQKLDVLESARDVGIKKSADLAGVHYTSVYQWQCRLKVLGEEVFLAYQKRSRGRGIKKVTKEQENGVLETWERYPGFGPSQVRNQLRRQGITISTRTVQRVMEANGYRGIRKKRDKEESQRFEASRPLELVQVDILEFFIHKLKVYFLLLLDDFSRFILGFRLSTETSIDLVIGVFQEAIDRYGKMEEVLSDRGFVFYSWRGINRFERLLQSERIDHTHARPHHPQTLGKVEACNRRIKHELLNQQHFSNLHEAQSALETWIERYNYKRPHQGIGGLLTPAERFNGQSEQILSAIDNSVDVTGENCFTSSGLERSIINLVCNPEGKITLYLLGQPIVLSGGTNERQTNRG